MIVSRELEDKIMIVRGGDCERHEIEDILFSFSLLASLKD